MLEKIRKAVYNVANWICIVALFLIIVVLLIVVIGRYFFNVTPSWSEEFSLFLLVWVGLFSSCIAEYHRSHVRLSFIDTMFPPKLLRAFGIIRYFLKLVFFMLMVYYGLLIFITTKQRFGAINLSFRWEVLPGLLTGVFCLLFLLFDTKRIFTDRHDRDAEKELEVFE
ncbi:MAG: TRAP transporter small permease subunit [Spirochaetales bacterium]|jgi:TRAP-type C4-dicarboxylate transport system permease small subunit|nr:TRAP transporter small permease subunit [Spirochaetales bacterium]